MEKETEAILEENNKILETARKRAGIDYKKVQETVLEFLEIAKNQNLNSNELRESLKLSQDSLDYSLSRLSANAWFATAVEKAKE